MKLTHEEAKELIARYHAKAVELWQGVEDVKISPIKNVQITEDGAFVEATVWISKQDLMA